MCAVRAQHRRVELSPTTDWNRDYAQWSLGQLVSMSDSELNDVDPLAINLLVARGIPSLARLSIASYQQTVNDWASDFRNRCLPRWEPHFHDAPQDFKHDLRYFRLGMICQYLDLEVGIKYKIDQRDVTRIRYTDPNDLFLYGLIDTRQGTCGNMAALHVALAWRMGWPVSMACIKSHYIARFDDGTTTYNIEATDTGRGGWSSRPDEQYIREYGITARSLSSGCELRALSPREMLGVFVGLRARHVQDVGKERGDEIEVLRSEADWLLARHLFPTDRNAFRNLMWMSLLRGRRIFDSDEIGSPIQFARDVLAEHGHQQPQFVPETNQRRKTSSAAEVISADLLDAILALPEGESS